MERTTEPRPEPISGSGIRIDGEQVHVAGQVLVLKPTELRILRLLVGTPGRVFSRQEILEGINDQDFAVTDRAVDVQIAILRKKLGSAAHLIQTVRGQGYRFVNPAPSTPST